MLRRLTIVAGAMLVLALALAACGEADEFETPINGGAPVDPTATPAATETPTPEPVDLSDTRWVLDSLDGERVPVDIEVTLVFEDGRQAGGNAGCNSYGASYELPGGGELTFIEMMQTEMYCGEPEGVMDVESAFTSALSNVAGFQTTDDRLMLLDADGSELLVFSRDDRAADPPLDGTSWIVTTLNGEPLLADTEITVELEDGRVVGSAGCNWYGGDYHSDAEGEISIPEIESTLVACEEPDGVMDQEAEFLLALREVAAYEHGDTTVELLDEAGTVRIVLAHPDEPRAQFEVGGTTWVLLAIDGSAVDADMPMTLHFTVNGPAGKADCMGYHSTFAATSDGEINQLDVRSYVVFCDEGAAPDVAVAYFEALERVERYQATENHLQFIDGDGRTVLEFRPGLDGGELDGSAWTMRSMHGEPPLEGTEITLTFDFEWATGDGGCNGWGGPYMVVEPGVVSFADIASTDMGCEDPAGVMNQEEEYLEALHRAVGYELTDSSLTLTDAGGETLLVFERAADRAELDGTSWSLLTLHGNPVIDGTDVTLTFRSGAIDGWSGCNAFGSRDVSVDGGSISIGPVASDGQGCADDVSRQEAEYYDSLQEVASYRVSESRLELLDAAGMTLLIFESRQ